MPKRITRIEKGQPIKATRLNEYGDNINEINRLVFEPPKQADEPPDPELGLEEADTTDDFVETSRIVTQVQVFDQNDQNYALIDRIEKITFSNGDGKTLTLNFNN